MKSALFRRVPADPPHLKVFHEGQSFKVALKRRPTAKRITLRVSNATGEVVLSIPERTDVGLAQKFADSHSQWIATRLAKVPERKLRALARNKAKLKRVLLYHVVAKKLPAASYQLRH